MPRTRRQTKSRALRPHAIPDPKSSPTTNLLSPSTRDQLVLRFGSTSVTGPFIWARLSAGAPRITRAALTAPHNPPPITCQSPQVPSAAAGLCGRFDHKHAASKQQATPPPSVKHPSVHVRRLQHQRGSQAVIAAVECLLEIEKDVLGRLEPDREPHLHVCMCACMHVCVYACVHVCMCACMHVCVYACVHVHPDPSP